MAAGDIEVLGCGVISWRPPPGNEGEELGYVVRFFDGDTYDSSASGYRSLQRYFDDIGRQWARAENLPTDGRTIYADVGRQQNGRVSHLHFLLQIYTHGFSFHNIHYHPYSTILY